MLAIYAGTSTVSGRFWLLDAPDNLDNQSRRNPDGAGIGWFDDDGTPRLDRAPLAALDDPAFARDARQVRSRAMVAHVRHSSGTPRRLENTMPFERAGRLFAHNGALGDLPAVKRLAGRWADDLAGDTDSERYLALVTRRATETGDLATGFARAAGELAATVPVLSLNSSSPPSMSWSPCATPTPTPCGCFAGRLDRACAAPEQTGPSGSPETRPATPT